MSHLSCPSCAFIPLLTQSSPAVRLHAFRVKSRARHSPASPFSSYPVIRNIRALGGHRGRRHLSCDAPPQGPRGRAGTRKNISFGCYVPRWCVLSRLSPDPSNRPVRASIVDAYVLVLTYGLQGSSTSCKPHAQTAAHFCQWASNACPNNYVIIQGNHAAQRCPVHCEAHAGEHS